MHAPALPGAIDELRKIIEAAESVIGAIITANPHQSKPSS
jgi:hypothetical protein